MEPLDSVSDETELQRQQLEARFLAFPHVYTPPFTTILSYFPEVAEPFIQAQEEYAITGKRKLVGNKTKEEFTNTIYTHTNSCFSNQGYSNC